MGRNNTKTKPAASAPDGGDIYIQPPTGRFSFENFGEWLTEHGYRLAVEDPPSESDIDTRKLFLTIFKDEKGATKKKGEHTLPEWADIIRTAHATIKDELLWLKGARFGDLLSDKGSYRTNKNVEALTAIVVEHDKGDVDFDHALTCVREAGVRAAGYTSPSYQKSIREKWRFIFPLSKDESPERHEILVAYANGIFHGALSNESFVLSQSYYFGSVNHNPDHRVEIVDGQFLDLADRLFAGRLYKGGTKEEPTPRAQRRKKNTTGPKSFWDTANDVFTNPEVDKDELVAALNIISADCVEPIWFEICCGLRHELGEDGFDIFDQWSATAKTEGKYDADVCKEKWKHAEDLEHAYTAGTIFKYANDADPDWKQKWQDSRTPPPDADDPPDSKTPPPKDKKPKPPLITATPFTLRDPSAIPQREWLYGRHLIRKMGSATIAPGGAGKSSLVIVEALAMVTGRPLLGITPQQCCKVWLWNGEDPLEEIERRIAAACEHFRIKAKDLEGNLFVNGRESEIIIAQQTRDGVKVAVPMVEALVKTLTDNEIDVLCIDPFISSHRVTENDNNSIDIVAKVWTKIADVTSTAIDLVHHVRKTGGAEVTIEDARGAGAMINAVRSSRVLNTMTKIEAEQVGITSHRGYFRVDDGKMNLAPPSDKAKWYHLKSIDLGNGPVNDRFEGGDKVAVVTEWEWPDPTDGVTGRDFEQVAICIRAGKWRENVQARDWVGIPIAKAMHLNLLDKADKAKIKSLIKYWISTGALVSVERMDDVRRTMKPFIEVAED